MGPIRRVPAWGTLRKHTRYSRVLWVLTLGRFERSHGVLRVLTLEYSEYSPHWGTMSAPRSSLGTKLVPHHGMISHKTGSDASLPGIPEVHTWPPYPTRHSIRGPGGVRYLHALAAAEWRRCRHRRPWPCLVGMPRRALHAGATRPSGSDPSSTRTGHFECSDAVR